MQETQVWSLGWEDPLEKGMATHSSILAWRISWTEQPGGLQACPWCSKGSDMTEATEHSHMLIYYEGFQTYALSLVLSYQRSRLRVTDYMRIFKEKCFKDRLSHFVRGRFPLEKIWASVNQCPLRQYFWETVLHGSLTCLCALWAELLIMF